MKCEILCLKFGWIWYSREYVFLPATRGQGCEGYMCSGLSCLARICKDPLLWRLHVIFIRSCWMLWMYQQPPGHWFEGCMMWRTCSCYQQPPEVTDLKVVCCEGPFSCYQQPPEVTDLKAVCCEGPAAATNSHQRSLIWRRSAVSRGPAAVSCLSQVFAGKARTFWPVSPAAWLPLD